MPTTRMRCGWGVPPGGSEPPRGRSLPLILERQGKDPLGPRLDDGASRRRAADLADGGIQIDEQMLAEKLRGAEADTGVTGAGAVDQIFRMARLHGLLLADTIKSLQIMSRAHGDGRPGEHHERFRAAG